jgi:hypothetical protein
MCISKRDLESKLKEKTREKMGEILKRNGEKNFEMWREIFL